MVKKECPYCFQELEQGEYFDYCSDCDYEVDNRMSLEVTLSIPNYDFPSADGGKEYELETIDKFGGFRVFISDKDIHSAEPPHVHIKRKTGSRDHAKFWLERLEFEYCFGFKVQEKKEIKDNCIEKNQQYLQKWYALKRQIGR